MLLECRLIVKFGIAEQLDELLHVIGAGDQYSEVVVADLVTEVPEERPIGLVH